MAPWLVTLLAVAGTTVLADPRFIFPEDAQALYRSSRIVSGWEAEDGQFPHQLSLRMVNLAGGVSSCSATLISAGWSLTAAHCTATRVTMVIRAGVLNLSRPKYIFETTKYYNHPLYNEAMQGVVQPNDIGLLEFGRDLEFSDTLKPIRLQSSMDKNRNYAGNRLITSGWGRTWTDASSPEILNWVYQLGISNTECTNAFGGSSMVVDSTICSRYYNVSSQSPCQGDSGGPLTIVDDDDEITQIGVTSFMSAMGCHVGMPTGFVRPGHYHDWFTELTGINFDWEKPQPESSESAPESSESAPDSTESAPESDETVPESSESAPDSSESSPDSSESAPGSDETSPESSESAPVSSESVPESSESAPESSESASESSEISPESPESDEAGPESPESVPGSSESAPVSSESAPDSDETGPESPESVPGSSESAPESSESAPESDETVPESSESDPNLSESAPESVESGPGSYELAPDSGEDGPESPESAPGSTESMLGSFRLSESSE